ncbi:uncharacterized protein DS421_1g26030 [Arachis hypogaea]|nr:uncharacterized protein DS421_1g26030 [Arachis hypogaea]
MTTGSRGRSSGSRGHGKGRASTESSKTAQSSPSIPATLLTHVTSQADPSNKQFIMVPNPNWVSSSDTPPLQMQ